MADESGGGVKNCAACKKVVKRVRRYYRDGKYYCTNNCWKSAMDKIAAESKAEVESKAKTASKPETGSKPKAKAKTEAVK